MTATVCRRAGAADAEHFAALHALCFDSPWDAAVFVRLLARSGALGLLAAGPKDNGPAGFALFEHVADEAEILTLGVAPACRGRGVAGRLLARGCDALVRCGVKRLHLEVAADNAVALALYRSAGFVHTGRRPGYYRRGSGSAPADGLILSCPLALPRGR
ncbi:MAG: GNAT family N-acetyltransferase [Alphaproteobacteria bacterium]